MVRYLIGIDLGTTNSALAYIDLERRSRSAVPQIHTFHCPQLTSAGELASRALLPSFLYLPGAHDVPAGSLALPWDAGRSWCVGEFARNQGAKVPGRLVTSAKSWLCHAGVDRSGPLLPWNAPPEVSRISPVEASMRYLRHLVEAWNHTMAANQPNDRLENLPVVLTVPASFDDVARNLTVEAARKAGIENLTLLEEPQAAFYCWFSTHSAGEAQQLRPGSRCVVVDVGGGTSDFSLIRAVEEKGELAFVRDAVGDHLLLGGDNMDLALARFIEPRLAGSGKLDAGQFGMLAQACRQAKEVLLGEAPPESWTVTVMGRGRQIIGGSLHTTLTAADVAQALFDGFFPQVGFDAEPTRVSRTGLHEMGLPYVSDPAITKHLAAFLRQHAPQGGTAQAPDAILFNGGVFQPASLRARILEVMRPWFTTPERPWQPLVLTNPSLDLAVAWGAAHFAWLKHTGGRRIGGGTARSYYLGIASDENATNKSSVVCVVGQHLEEGVEVVLDRPVFELALGQPVQFPLYTSTVRADDHPGDLLQVVPDQLRQLPPLHTVLRGGKRSGSKRVPVTLAARSTEVGTLELWCVARDGDNRWRLEFNVRDTVKEPVAEPAGERPVESAVTDVWPEGPVQAAATLLRHVFTSDRPEPPPAELGRSLESALEAARHEWPTGLCRRLWEFLLPLAEERHRSPAHRNRWFNLVGYCLRPGFGDPLDRYRVEQLWKLLNAPIRPGELPGKARLPDVCAEYWVMWRRVGGGLHAALQRSLYDRLRPVLLPGKYRNAIKPNPNELAEMWRAAASLERLDARQKEGLGEPLLKLARRSPVPPYVFWALTRLGARTLIYGPLNALVHPEVVGRWLDSILTFRPGNESERLAWTFCLSELARRTGQRALDIDDERRQRVLSLLTEQQVPERWLQMVKEVTEREGEEQGQLLGDSLPIGLRLLSGEQAG